MKTFFKTTKLAGFILIALVLTKCKKDSPGELSPANTELSSMAKQIPALTSSSKLLLNPTTTKSVPVSYNGISNQVISGLQINGINSVCIKLANCANITIQNCVLYGSTHEGITLFQCKNITIINCYIFNVSAGVYASASSGVNVCYNQFLNMQGPAPGGNFVQFDNVSGAGNMINYNMCENIHGQSNPFDEISIYKSNGTPDSPIEINGNYIRGGGPSTISAGIQLADNGGSYQVAENNILVNPGNSGIAVSTGNNIQVLNNKVYSKPLSFSNVGIYVWNEYKSTCALNTVTGNTVKWMNAQNEENDKWNGGGCGKIAGWADNTWRAKIDSTILPQVIITKTFVQE
jgi:parallel beta-helix repeat protein